MSRGESKSNTTGPGAARGERGMTSHFGAFCRHGHHLPLHLPAMTFLLNDPDR